MQLSSLRSGMRYQNIWSPKLGLHTKSFGIFGFNPSSRYLNAASLVAERSILLAPLSSFPSFNNFSTTS